jgi:hypothetical protein
MTPHRSFFIGLPAGLGLAFGIFATMTWLRLGVPTPVSNWCWQMQQKKESLAAAEQKPRLLIVGGSSVLFGVQAALIQRETGQPTINLGTHAALGPRYLLNRARAVVRPGDTVLLALEYELYEWGDADGARWMDAIYVDYLLSSDPGYFRSLPWTRLFEVAMRQPINQLSRAVRARFNPKPIPRDPIYDVANLNANGDLTGHIASQRQGRNIDIDHPHAHLINGFMNTAGAWQDIADFCSWAESNRVRVLATFPNLAHRPEYDAPAGQQAPAQIEHFYNTHNVQVVGTAREAMRPPEAYFDTRYHLTEEAAAARTRALIVSLRPILKK